MYAIRCKVHHDYLAQSVAGIQTSEYIVIVDTSKLSTAFDVARRAMIEDKFHGRYDKSRFEFGAGAQKVDGNLNNGKLYSILFTGVNN